MLGRGGSTRRDSSEGGTHLRRGSSPHDLRKPRAFGPSPFTRVPSPAPVLGHPSVTDGRFVQYHLNLKHDSIRTLTLKSLATSRRSNNYWQ